MIFYVVSMKPLYDFLLKELKKGGFVNYSFLKATIVFWGMSAFISASDDEASRVKRTVCLKKLDQAMSQSQYRKSCGLSSQSMDDLAEESIRERNVLIARLSQNITWCDQESSFKQYCEQVYDFCEKYAWYMTRTDLVVVDGEPQKGYQVVNDQLIGLLHKVAVLHAWPTEWIPLKVASPLARSFSCKEVSSHASSSEHTTFSK